MIFLLRLLLTSAATLEPCHDSVRKIPITTVAHLGRVPALPGDPALCPALIERASFG